MSAEKPAKKRQRPKRLHLTSTDAERSLWELLRDRQVAGARFMRHFPMGRLVVDFVCRERRLAVVIDGGRHSNAERDENRDQSLLSRGYRVLRFRHDDVLKNPQRVRDAINAALLENDDHPDKKMQ